MIVYCFTPSSNYITTYRIWGQKKGQVSICRPSLCDKMPTYSQIPDYEQEYNGTHNHSKLL